MRLRTVVLTAAAVGIGYAVWRMPATQRFVATVKEASARREAELREAIEVAVLTDATTRAPRYASGVSTPGLDVTAGWDDDRRPRTHSAGALADPGRGEGAVARPHGRASSVGAASPHRRAGRTDHDPDPPNDRTPPRASRHTMTRARTPVAPMTPKD